MGSDSTDNRAVGRPATAEWTAGTAAALTWINGFHGQDAQTVRLAQGSLTMWSPACWRHDDHDRNQD